MPIKIYTFGFKYRPTCGDKRIQEPKDKTTPTYIGNNMILDVRGWLLDNPYHNRKLRLLNGLHPDVQADIRKSPYFEIAYEEIKKLVSGWGGVVWIGCTGGKHRSVFIGSLLGKDLGVKVVNLHIHNGSIFA